VTSVKEFGKRKYHVTRATPRHPFFVRKKRKGKKKILGDACYAASPFSFFGEEEKGRKKGEEENVG
jgi:hypothetical protein